MAPSTLATYRKLKLDGLASVVSMYAIITGNVAPMARHQGRIATAITTAHTSR